MGTCFDEVAGPKVSHRKRVNIHLSICHCRPVSPQNVSASQPVSVNQSVSVKLSILVSLSVSVSLQSVPPVP